MTRDWSRRGWAIVCSAPLAILGCGDGEEGTYVPPRPRVVVADALPVRGQLPKDLRAKPPEDLDWTRCSLQSAGTEKDAECATVSVPVRWDEPEGDTLQLSIKRTRFTANPRGQLWLLSGGPGAAASDFEPQVGEASSTGDWPTFEEMAPDLEVYLLDHRGTGQSSRLRCPDEESDTSPGKQNIVGSEWESCRDSLVKQWGKKLDGFTVTEAARDLGALVQRTRHGAEPVFVYAVSYGTIWAQRYLQLFPDVPAGVVLDSSCAPGACQFGLGFDRGFNRVGKKLMDLCAQDSECLRVLGPDPWATLQEVSDAIDHGSCPDLELTKAQFRQMLALMLAIWPYRDLVPAAVERIRNCDVGAVKVLQSVLGQVGASSADTGFSPVLFEHIAQAELLEDPAPTEDQVDQSLASLFFSTDLGKEIAQVHALGWPTPPKDPFAGQYAKTQVPLLILSGELDPQTPPEVSAPLATYYRGAHQTYVSVPSVAHGVLNQSPTRLDMDGSVHTCGQEMVTQFLANPGDTIDQFCVSQIAPVTFTDDTLSFYVFGDDSTWGARLVGR